MNPAPTNMVPKFTRDPNLKAILFDVYGTIVISASGDVEESEITTLNLKKSLDAAGIFVTRPEIEVGDILLQMLDAFKNKILAVHESEKTDERPFPEVDILNIWESVIKEFQSRNLLIVENPICIKCFTFIFEVLSNTIYPMPGMKSVISRLSEKGFPLGIISNAQFYTPVILNYFMNNLITEALEVKPFDKDISVFSYQHQRSKPDNYLFDMVKIKFQEKYSIRPSEILFVGNDMYRDIFPASKAGFKTVLFAGDKRSLRLRQDNPELKDLEPDYVITDLNQLLKILE
jgi:putative hydrolase of the HAD superfamily